MHVYSITHSGPNSYVFVNMVGHGTTGFVAFDTPDGYDLVSAKLATVVWSYILLLKKFRGYLSGTNLAYFFEKKEKVASLAEIRTHILGY